MISKISTSLWQAPPIDHAQRRMVQQQPHKSWTQAMGSGHTLRGQEQLFLKVRAGESPEKSRKPAIFQNGTHLAKKLFCVPGNQRGLGNGPWMAIGGRSRPS